MFRPAFEICRAGLLHRARIQAGLSWAVINCQTGAIQTIGTVSRRNACP
jgi:hypothetical protein